MYEYMAPVVTDGLGHQQDDGRRGDSEWLHPRQLARPVRIRRDGLSVAQCRRSSHRRMSYVARCIRFIAILLPALPSRVVARNVVFLLSTMICTGTGLAQTLPEATPETAQVTEAFSELDALAAAIAGRLQDLAQHTGLPAPPPASVPTSPPTDKTSPTSASSEAEAPPSPRSESHDVAGASLQGRPEPCGTREDMDLRIGNLEKQFDKFRQTINAANGDLPTYRNDVRDISKICQQQVPIDSAVKGLDRLRINPTYDEAVELLACVDDRRRTTDAELNRSDITTIRIRILTEELDRLTDTTHRVQNMEQALLRAKSKQARLLEELTQFRQEITSACGA